MNDLNEVLFEGRLVRSPRARKLESGAVFCSFVLASNTYYINKKTGQKDQITTYMLVETWKNVAETCAKYLDKGAGVRITGKLRQSKWKKENIDMEKTYIAADHVEFIPKSAKASAEPELPVQVKTAEEEPDVLEQKEIDQQVIDEPED